MLFVQFLSFSVCPAQAADDFASAELSPYDVSVTVTVNDAKPCNIVVVWYHNSGQFITFSIKQLNEGKLVFAPPESEIFLTDIKAKVIFIDCTSFRPVCPAIVARKATEDIELPPIII